MDGMMRYSNPRMRCAAAGGHLADLLIRVAKLSKLSLLRPRDHQADGGGWLLFVFIIISETVLLIIVLRGEDPPFACPSGVTFSEELIGVRHWVPGEIGGAASYQVGDQLAVLPLGRQTLLVQLVRDVVLDAVEDDLAQDFRRQRV
jgi:hypothetical protein